MTIMWTSICIIFHTIILISADRTGKNKKRCIQSCVTVSSVCFVCCRAGVCLCVTVHCWASGFTESSDYHTWAEAHRWIVRTTLPEVPVWTHVYVCASCSDVTKRICFHLQWNCSLSEIRWFADSWQTEACSYHVPPQPATQFKFYFHASALTIFLYIYTCMKYNPAVQF